MLLLVECASLAGLIAVAAWWASGDFKLAVLLWLLVALTPLLAGRDLPDYAWLRPLLWGLEFTALAIIVVVKLDPWVVLGIASALGCVALWRNRGHVMDHALAPRYRTGLAAALGTLAVIAIGTPWLMRCASAYDEMEDWRNEPVFAAVARGKGLLLTEPRLRATQLRTRRPVLLEATALNQIPYVPASAPAINRILQAIYDEDILGPRMPEWRHNPTLPVPEAKRLWKARSQREWLALAREFGFTDVLTRDDWKLRLPVVAKSGSMTLYHVPGAERPITDKVASRTAD